MQKEPVVYLNGKFVPKSQAQVSVLDHGLLYGDGVFEGIRAYNGVVFLLQEHIERLFASAKYIQLKVPLTHDELVEAAIMTLRRNNLRDAYIRIVITRGTGDLSVDPALCKQPTIFIITEPMKNVLGPRDPRVISAIISHVRRDSVDATTHEVKSLNYLNSILARIEATNAGVDDAIMLDNRGFVSEGTVANVFVVKKGAVYTPLPTSGILHGITRERILKLCNQLGIPVMEKDMTPFELISADEVFLVGTKSEILAVESINHKTIRSGEAGPITRMIFYEFRKIVDKREEGTPIYEEESVKVRR